MKNPKAALGGLIFLILVATGIFAHILGVFAWIVKFSLWLFSISMTEFGISSGAEIFVKVFTFIISYALVGFLFSFDNGFRSKGKAMSIAYVVISTLLGFALSAAIMFLEKNIVTIFWIVLSVVIFIVLSIGLYYLIKFIKNRNIQKV